MAKQLSTIMRTKRSIDRQKKGFTLLEVVVATGLMTTALLAIFSLLRISLTARTQSQKQTEAVLLAQSRLTEVLLEKNPVYETREGTTGSFDWQIKTVPTNIENLAAVQVRVQWSQQHRTQSFDLITLRMMKTFTESN